jgi:hypothetical protein
MSQSAIAAAAAPYKSADPGQVAGNLRAPITAFDGQIGRLDRAKLLYIVLSKVTEVNLHPDKVTNVEMGYI